MDSQLEQFRAELAQVERLCAAALTEPTRHIAVRFLVAALDGLGSELLPGIRNVGMLATQELRTGVPERSDWRAACNASARLLRRGGRQLIEGLGFDVEVVTTTASVLTANGAKRAVAVFLDDTEGFEEAGARFSGASPVSHGLAVADRENLPWVILTRGRQISPGLAKHPTLLPSVMKPFPSDVLPRPGLLRPWYVGSRPRKVTTVDECDWLAQRFEEHRAHLRAVAYRMLGSHTEADDAVQGAWLRHSHAATSGVHDLRAWLTTLVARECLDLLRARTARREDPVGMDLPDPIVSHQGGVDPEQQALLAEGVGLALLVVMDTLTPAERLAFVLHDMFAVPFAEIAPIVGRSANAAKMLASRARRRVQGVAPLPDADLARQREVVEAFLAAAREGDFAALVALLDPEVVVRADRAAPGGISVVRGAAAAAEQVLATGGFARFAQQVQPAMVNGAAGVVLAAEGRPFAVVGFTVRHGKIAEIDIFSDPARLRRLDLAVPDH